MCAGLCGIENELPKGERALKGREKEGNRTHVTLNQNGELLEVRRKGTSREKGRKRGRWMKEHEKKNCCYIYMLLMKPDSLCPNLRFENKIKSIIMNLMIFFFSKNKTLSV